MKLLEFYQRLFSSGRGWLGIRPGKVCVFYPSCSEYVRQAVVKYGIFKGPLLGLKRIIRCHPWQKDYFNPLI
ncbi:MAG: membrane protein insertion efficiency factor YidD [Patescibacteria group bacterium]